MDIIERITAAAKATEKVYDWHISQKEPIRNHRHLGEATENIAKLKSKATALLKELEAVEDVVIRQNFEPGDTPQKMDITVLKEAFRRFKEQE